MEWEKPWDPLLRLLDDIPATLADVRQPTVWPLLWICHSVGPDRIPVDVIEDLEEILQAVYDPGKEPVPPDMPGYASAAIVCHGEHAHDPLHYGGEVCPVSGLDNEMEMVVHDAEVLDPEIVFPVCPFYHRKKQILDGVRVEDHFLAVGAGGDMVAGAIL